MANEPEPVLTSDSPLEEWAKSAQHLSDRCDEKRQLLLRQAISRSWWLKWLQIASGIVALVSGMLGAAGTSGMIGFLGGPQLVAAELAFLSGMVSLITTALFEDSVTQKMFAGAHEFLVARDQLRTLYHRRGTLDAGQFMNALEPLRAQYHQTTKEYDRWLEQ